jgi:hypothetical protein
MLNLVRLSRAKPFYDYCQIDSSLGQGFNHGTACSTAGIATWNRVEKDPDRGLILPSHLSPVRFAGMLGVP